MGELHATLLEANLLSGGWLDGWLVGGGASRGSGEWRSLARICWKRSGLCCCLGASSATLLAKGMANLVMGSSQRGLEGLQRADLTGPKCLAGQLVVCGWLVDGGLCCMRACLGSLGRLLAASLVVHEPCFGAPSRRAMAGRGGALCLVGGGLVPGVGSWWLHPGSPENGNPFLGARVPRRGPATRLTRWNWRSWEGTTGNNQPDGWATGPLGVLGVVSGGGGPWRWCSWCASWWSRCGVDDLLVERTITSRSSTFCGVGGLGALGCQGRPRWAKGWPSWVHWQLGWWLGWGL